MDMSDGKDSDERDEIYKNYEEILTNNIEVLKMEIWVRKKIQTILRNNLMIKSKWV